MIQNIRRSLTDLLGAEYTAAVGGRSIFIPRLLPAARRS